MKVKRLDRDWDLLVDVSQGRHLLDIDQAGADPAIADVELDALVEENSVLKKRLTLSAFVRSLCHLRHHSYAAP